MNKYQINMWMTYIYIIFCDFYNRPNFKFFFPMFSFFLQGVVRMVPCDIAYSNTYMLGSYTSWET